MKPNLLCVLSEKESEDLSSTALGILEEFGVLVTHVGAIDVLLKAGASKADDGRIRMDGDLVQGVIDKAPKRFELYDRLGGSIEVGSGTSWTMSGGTVSRVIEWPGWPLRPASREDVGKFARLCDALPLVHCVVPMVEAQDVEPSQAEILTFADTIANTTKFVFVCPVLHSSAKAWVEMGRIAAGRRDLSQDPTVGLLATILPNLYLEDECAATVLVAASEGIPLVSMAGGMAGSSGPNTIAGTSAMKHAGGLFVVALSQMVRPGTPVILDHGVSVLDMNTIDIGEAGPEYPLSIASLAQASRRYGIPSYSCALHCEAKTGDFQAGLEKMAGMMGAMLAGVDLSTNMGMLSRCSAASYEQLVVDDELCAFLARFGAGVTVSDDTLALDVVREVGLGGEFITHEHTVKHCRSGEIWYPALLDRTAVGAGAVDLYGRAHNRADEILEGHRPEVDPRVIEELQSCATSLAGSVPE